MSKAVASGEFGGVAKDVEPTNMPPNLYGEDQGGDRYFRGAWRRRRGMLHSDQAAAAAPIRSILGFEMAGDDFAVMFVSGVNVVGALNVTDQTYP